MYTAMRTIEYTSDVSHYSDENIKLLCGPQNPIDDIIELWWFNNNAVKAQIDNVMCNSDEYKYVRINKCIENNCVDEYYYTRNNLTF